MTICKAVFIGYRNVTDGRTDLLYHNHYINMLDCVHVAFVILTTSGGARIFWGVGPFSLPFLPSFRFPFLSPFPPSVFSSPPFLSPPLELRSRTL